GSSDPRVIDRELGLVGPSTIQYQRVQNQDEASILSFWVEVSCGDIIEDAPAEHHVDLVAPFKKSVKQIICEKIWALGEREDIKPCLS
ncbi:hypothetical protein U1Q18_016023, partial [Sarracenia purpurea var. burkii]